MKERRFLTGQSTEKKGKRQAALLIGHISNGRFIQLKNPVLTEEQIEDPDEKRAFNLEGLTVACNGCGTEHPINEDYCNVCGQPQFNTPGTPRQLFVCPDCHYETDNENCFIFCFCPACNEEKDPMRCLPKK